ncbi:MAG: tRNA (adenosine(37)-N6)-threonylcarbamoyltransferase complex ATPase subunit type 1 TsaE [Flavobacteriales bacterium]
MPIRFELPRPEDAPEIADALLAAYPKARVFAFEGPLGAGKTTFIKALCRRLGVAGGMGSPSFAIVNEYRSGDGEPVYHFDLYRLKKEQELEGIGFTEYVDSGHYCFIEWPELALPLLPPDHVAVHILPLPDGTRTLTTTATTPAHPA